MIFWEKGIMYNKIKICTAAAALICAVNLSAVSLKQSVEKTLNVNPGIIAEYMNREAYKKYVDEEEGDYLPTLNLEAYAERSKTYENRDNAADNWINKDGWYSALKFEHILYDGGLTPSEAAEFRHKFYGNNYRSTQEVESTILDVADAYLDLVSKQELIALSKYNIKIHEEYLTVAKEKEQISGEVLETYQVNSKYHFVLDKFLEQQNEMDQSLSLYKSLVGEELEGNICRPAIDDKYIPSTLQEAIELGLRRNYKIKEQIEKINEQRERIVQEESAYRPTISFQFQTSLDNDLELDDNGRQDIYRSRIYMTWNLFNGGKTYHATQKEQLFLKEEQKKLDQITNEVVDEIKSVYRTYQNYKKRIKNIKLYVDDNFEILSVYKKQLLDGTRTFLDILNAESELYRAYITKIEQEFELLSSYYQLLFNMSVLSDTILMQQEQVCPKYVFTPRVDESLKEQENDKLSSELLNVFDEEPKKGLEKKSEEKKPAPEDMLKMDNSTSVDISSRLEDIYGRGEISDSNTQAVKKTLESPESALGGKYTLNMANFKTQKEVQDFIKKYSLEDKASFYRFGKNGENIKLLYGSYENLISAGKDMEMIDKKALSYGAYIDNIKKHDNLKIKYKDFN
jgi:adhesin transport system outer membrane protein